MNKYKLIIIAILLTFLLAAAVVKASTPTYSVYIPFVQGGPVPCANEFATRAECD
jgi:hypothetical protein